MNNKVIGIAVAVILLGVIVYFVTANKGEDTGNQEQAGQNQQQNTSQQNTQSKPNSLKDLLATNAQSCTYGDGDNTGVVYTSNGKVRMDMTTKSNGVEMASHAVIDGQTYYSWVDGQPSGYKFSIAQASTGSAGPNQNVDINQQVGYNCNNWTAVDSSKFALPSNVTFMDLNAMGQPTQ